MSGQGGSRRPLAAATARTELRVKGLTNNRRQTRHRISTLEARTTSRSFPLRFIDRQGGRIPHRQTVGVLRDEITNTSSVVPAPVEDGEVCPTSGAPTSSGDDGAGIIERGSVTVPPCHRQDQPHTVPSGESALYGAAPTPLTGGTPGNFPTGPSFDVRKLKNGRVPGREDSGRRMRCLPVDCRYGPVYTLALCAAAGLCPTWCRHDRDLGGVVCGDTRSSAQKDAG